MPDQGKRQAEQWRKHQTPKSKVFRRIDNWLQEIALPPMPLFEQESEWQEFGKVTYWMGFIGQEERLYGCLDWTVLHQAVESLSLESLAILIYGLWQTLSSTEPFTQWYKEVRSQLLERYRIETNSPYVEERDMVIRAHFVVPLEESETEQSGISNNAQENRFHFMAIRHVQFLAQLFPDCIGYGCQGYGHQVFDFYTQDDTAKTKIEPWYLTPDWVTQVNRTARILASHLFRPPTWKDYIAQVFGLRTNTVLLLNELCKGLVRHFRSKKPIQQLARILDTRQWKECTSHIMKMPGLPLEALDSLGYTEETIKGNPFEKRSGSKEQFIVSTYLMRYQVYLQTKSDFFRGLSNFLEQSSHLLVAHTFLGKAKTTEDRLRLEQTIHDLNLKVDRPFLPGYNLGEALKVLPKYQFCFRKHFSGLLDKEELYNLEKRELQTFRALWTLWFFFVTQPSRYMQMPGKTARTLLDSRIQATRKSIESALRKASTEKLQFCCLGDSVQFEAGPALWITADGENPLVVYSQPEELFMLIKDSLGDIELHSLEYFALESQWQHFVIVPICGGKLLDKHAWALPVYQFVSELNQNGGLSPINLVPRPIEHEVLDRLGLELWEPALLGGPTEFVQNAASLQLRLRHLVQIGNLPNLGETGTQMIRSYFDKLKEEVSVNLQQVIEKAGILVSQFDQVSSTYREAPAFEYLQLATDQLREIYDKLIPDGLENGQVAISIQALRKWEHEVSSVLGEIFITYLLWCGYILNMDVHLRRDQRQPEEKGSDLI